MGTFKINYDEVNAEISRLRTALTADIINTADREHRKIQSELRQLDGAANAGFQEIIEENRAKVAAAAKALDKVLRFISNAAGQIRTSEEQLARAFRITKR